MILVFTIVIACYVLAAAWLICQRRKLTLGREAVKLLRLQAAEDREVAERLRCDANQASDLATEKHRAASLVVYRLLDWATYGEKVDDMSERETRLDQLQSLVFTDPDEFLRRLGPPPQLTAMPTADAKFAGEDSRFSGWQMSDLRAFARQQRQQGIIPLSHVTSKEIGEMKRSQLVGLCLRHGAIPEPLPQIAA